MYLGDSVYADADDYYIIIYLNNGEESFNMIYLNPDVMENLINYYRNRKSTGSNNRSSSP